MKSYTTVIVDDEVSAISLLTSLLKPFDQVKIEQAFTDPKLACHEIIKRKPDLLFLDIQMGKMTGFDLLEEIWKANVRPMVIICTAYDEYAIEALRHAAIDYLLKPISIQDLEGAITRLKQQDKQESADNSIAKLINHLRKEKRLRFNTRNGFVLIDPNEIVYCEADGNYSVIHCKQSFKEVVCVNMSHLEQILPAGKFTRISRSYLVNSDCIRKIDRKNRLVFLEYQQKMVSIKFSANRYSALDWLFGGG